MKIISIIFNKISVLIVSLIVSTFILSAFVSSEYGKLKVAKVESKLKSENLEVKRNLINEIKNYNKINEDLKDKDLEKIYDLPPDDNNFEKYIAILEYYSKGLILINDYSINQGEEHSGANNKDNPDSIKTNIPSTGGSFTASGSFSNFIFFLSRVEKNIPIIDIESIDISKADVEDEEQKFDKNSILNYEVNFVFYHR